MRHKLIIFDFDGTIADTRSTIVRTFRMTMEKLRLPLASEEACAATIGLPLEKGFATLLPDLPEERVRECAATYRALFEENKSELLPQMFPGVGVTLRSLASEGRALTIASSRHRASIEEFLRNFGVRDFFPYILGAGDVSKAKPDPEPVLRTLADLKFRAEDAMVVGDMPFDILMGKRAGAAACGVTYGNSTRSDLLDAGADFVIDSFPALLGIV